MKKWFSKDKEKIVKQYTNGEITVVWQPHLCIHVATCFIELPEVFKPSQRPWIRMDGASSERIMEICDKCPTEAIAYFKNSEKEEGQDNGGLVGSADGVVNLKANKRYAWCSCKLSKNEPFCDGAHKGTSFRPKVFLNHDEGETKLCMCKKTKNPPYCDGSHNNLDDGIKSE